MLTTCPHCNTQYEINPAALLGAVTSEKKAAAAVINGKKGGRPRKSDK